MKISASIILFAFFCSDETYRSLQLFKKSNLQQTSRQLGASPGKNWSDYQVRGVEGQGNVATNMEIL